jgi:hypothetical protein
LKTPDIDPDTHVPDDPENFAFLVEMIAGPSNGPGDEQFQFIVCTAGYLAEQVRRRGPMPGHHLVIVDRYHWPTIKEYFERLVTRVWGADWREVARKLSRHSIYEFEEDV